jgi:hypothetical protein
MDILIGSNVYWSNVPCGFCTHVLIDPRTNRLTHLVVAQGKPQPAARIVPVQWLDTSAPQHLILRCSKAELADSVRLRTEPLHTDTIQVSMSPGKDSSPALALAEGAWVEAWNGYVGLIAGFRIDPRTYYLTHVIVHETHLWGEGSIAIPADAVSRITENRVLLTLDIDNIETLADPVESPSATDY